MLRMLSINKLMLIALLIAFSFGVNANEMKIGNTGLVLKNHKCHSGDYFWVYNGHLVNRSDKRITGALCFDFYDNDNAHVSTCSGSVDLKAKKGKLHWSTSAGYGEVGLCLCYKGRKFTFKFLKNGVPKDCY